MRSPLNKRLLPGEILGRGGSLEGRLVFVSPKYPSGFGIDQVGLHANRARDRLISRALAFGRIVSDPALHLHSCIRATVDEGRHFQPIQNLSPDDRRPRPRGDRCGQGRRRSSTFGPAEPR
jgi:hypothetical protein